MQKGEQGDWVDYTKKNFFKMISDHPEALKMAEAHKGELTFSKNVMEILAVYNKE